MAPAVANPPPASEIQSAEVVVVGATPAGIACAVRAAREGSRVLLVERTQHLGGFMASGAGGWEAPYDRMRSPIYAEVRQAASDYYRDQYGEGSPQHRASFPSPASNRHIDRAKIEPKVAELLFNQMVEREPGLSVLKGYLPVSVNRYGETIESIVLERAKVHRQVETGAAERPMAGPGSITVKGKVFVDATYEGDLAALAQAPYRVGRESRSEYGEPHAGVVFTRDCAESNPSSSFPVDALEGKLKTRTFPSRMCKEEVLPQSTGAADPHVMAYNYRLILTNDPTNRVPNPKPKNYDPAPFAGYTGDRYVPDLPNGKIARNAGRIVGPQLGYPDGNWPTRDQISEVYLNYILGQLWYLQHDPAVPSGVQAFWRDYGLAKDEFADNGNIPYEIYVREARRIVGPYVYREQDVVPAVGIERTPIHRDGIAITDWPVDSLPCTERTVPGGNPEGQYFLVASSRPSQIPYRCLLANGLDNLLVPVCLSTSHVGWGSVRLEPVWMQTGEVAGFAASQASNGDTAPARLDVESLLRNLARRGVELAMFNDIDVAASDPQASAVQYFATKGFFRSYDALPAMPLTPEVATIWLNAFSMLVAKTPLDPMDVARSLPKADQQDAPVLTRDQLASLVTLKLSGLPANSLTKQQESMLDHWKTASNDPVTRGEACRILFELIDQESMSAMGHKANRGS